MFSRMVRCHKKGFRKNAIGSEQGMTLVCTQRANINNMHVNLSWLKVKERMTSSLLLFMRGIDMLNAHTVEVRSLHTLRLESLKLVFQPLHKFIVNKL